MGPGCGADILHAMMLKVGVLFGEYSKVMHSWIQDGDSMHV